MRRNNRGFSMVELIIVIAIMAILVGIVGSQVLPYLNKSREAKDQQILSGWITASTSAYAVNAAELSDETYTIKLDNTNGVRVPSGANKDKLEDEFIDYSGVDRDHPLDVFTSKLYKQITVLTFTIQTEVDGGRNTVCICDIQGVTDGTIITSELVAN